MSSSSGGSFSGTILINRIKKLSISIISNIVKMMFKYNINLFFYINLKTFIFN
mgnify:CR=1 FL=1